MTLRLLNKATAQLLSAHKVVRAAEPLPVHEYARVPQPLVHRSTLIQRKQIVCGAARGGSLEAVQAALKATGLCPDSWLFTAAAAAPGPGVALALCEGLAAMGCPLHNRTFSTEPSTLCSAAAAGNGDVCDWLLAGGRCAWGEAAAFAAARGGHADLAQRLLYLCPKDGRADCAAQELVVAAAHGCGVRDLERTYTYWLGGRAQQLQQWRLQLHQQPQQQPPPADGQPQQPHPMQAGNAAAGRFGPAYVEKRSDGFRCEVADAQFEAMLIAAAGSPTACWLEKLDVLLRRHCDEANAQLASGRDNDALLVRLYEAAMQRPDGLDRVRAMWEQRRWRPSGGADLMRVVEAAARRGDVPALRYLLDTVGARTQLRWGEQCCMCAPLCLRAAAAAGSVEALQLLVGCYGSLGCCDFSLSCVLEDAAAEGHIGVVEWVLREAAKPATGRAAAVACWRREGLPKFLKRGAAEVVMERGLLRGQTEVVRWALDHGVRATQGRGFVWWLVAARAGCVEVLRQLAECGCFKPGAEAYSGALGDRRTLRELSRLRLGGSSACQGLLALLEDPDVPLSELRWLLEGDREGAAAALLAALNATKGKALRLKDAAYSVRACAVLGGPAAEGLRHEGEWQLAVQAVARRGEGPEAQEIRAWLEQWRRENAGRMVPGRMRL
ncbi:hypothetical protein CHLRE_06g298200v5 [Chlamydomonas reinhardtii]|uniref:Ankyrin repeat domain-containing protein n=1 Tax=Chlamydomonas reinhardtii TaxID=3055 RepID=A0A2K3DQR3_CHLRE|nr:uncharacterized protein CHLRE_06g298200v5 [Chlamydomonas reinhardtii]PNW82882.1 hypothetical protein CHLRE_06g298200v5 [Chlamydomonas reinhardtii]